MVSKLVNFCDRDHNGEEIIAVETVTFMADANTMEMDLCPDHLNEWADFETAQQIWTSCARLKGRQRAGAGDKPRESRTQEERRETAAVRAWALEQGLTTSTRGRVSQDLRQQYRQAQEREAHGRWDGAGGGRGSLRPPPTPSLRPVPSTPQH